MIKFEYMVMTGAYGTLEDTLNFYGEKGWLAAKIEMEFPYEKNKDGAYTTMYSRQTTFVPHWLVVFERQYEEEGITPNVEPVGADSGVGASIP